MTTGPAIAVVAASAVVSAGLVRAVRDFANRRSLLDHPNERSSHATPKPRLGGIGVVTPVLAAGVGAIVLGKAAPSLALPLAATAGVALLGLADDVRPLPVRLRFGVQVALAALVVASAWDRLPAAAGLLGGVLPRPAIAAAAVLWIVWLTNLYNFMDGIDGLAGGQALIASLGLAAGATGAGAGMAAALLVAVAGSSLGFLLFNFPPSSIFMGDVGSTALGFLFGCLPLLPDAHAIPVETVALALSLFLLDATTSLLRRMARGERWHTPHRTHLYQRPVVAGISHRAVTLTAWAGMTIAACCAVVWPVASRVVRAVLVLVPVALFAVGHVLVRCLESRTGGCRPVHQR